MTDPLQKAAEMALEVLKTYDGKWLEDGRKVFVEPEIKELEQALAQTEQEPVAWMYTSHYKGNEWFITRYQSELTTYKADKVQPLYTAPPSIEAAVLAEREACAKFCETQRNDIPATGKEFAAAIRARREK